MKWLIMGIMPRKIYYHVRERNIDEKCIIHFFAAFIFDPH